MTQPLTLFVNNQSVFEYDRDTHLDDDQRAFLARMDRDMDRGVKMNGVLYEQPTARQRLTFVAMNLLRALQQDNDAKIAVACAYLSQRSPALLEVHANDHDNGIMIELLNENGAD